MEWFVSSDAEAAERAAAAFIASRLARAVADRQLTTLAISGGRSPWGMLASLADADLPWAEVHLFQVDERRVPLEHEARNWARFLENPLAMRIEESNRHPMPVEAKEAELAVGRYSQALASWAGAPPSLDVVHLGIGEDGHTASLFAGDPLLQDRRHWVGLSRPREGHRRLTLTLPVINAAQAIVWFATGSARREILARLRAGDPDIPASLVQRDRAFCFTDAAAAP